MAQMRAVVAQRPDGPDGLVVCDVSRPEPREGWALVRVEAFGLNRSEYKTLRGFAGDAVSFPRILGIELVGVVEATHGEAPLVPPGRKVAALMGDLGRAFDGGFVGTLVFVRPGVRRTALAHEPGTTIIAVDGIPGKLYEPGGLGAVRAAAATLRGGRVRCGGGSGTRAASGRSTDSTVRGPVLQRRLLRKPRRAEG